MRAGSGQVRGGDGGHLGVVVGGGDLDHVRADQPGLGQAAQDAEQFPGRQAAASGVPVPGAWTGSSTTMSGEIYSGASPTPSRIRATTPPTPSRSVSMADTMRDELLVLLAGRRTGPGRGAE